MYALNRFNDVFSDMDRVFNNLSVFDTQPKQPSLYHFESLDDSYLLEVEAPGFSKDEISIDLDKGVISIKAERKTKTLRNKINHRFTIPENVKTENIDATLKDGILSIKLPKEEQKKLKQIEIK